ncbi:extracellular solute-binding protein [Synechococcus sp. M16CYN]|uniref:extracellular solute-binding protein n=1 Tax=Synechococcus sp. M16CYN TaxID=3103139 RepID=UPI003251342D
MSIQLTRRKLLLSGVAAGLAACGRRYHGPELNLWTLQLAPKFNPYFTDLTAAWATVYPQNPLRWSDLPWGSVERKLLSSVYARTAPDVVNLNPPFAASLASKGGLTNLTPLLPSSAAKRYLPSVWQACRNQEAGQFAVPWYLTVRLSLVNRQLLDQAGIASPPTCWDQVPAFAKRIRERTGRYGLFLTMVPDDSVEMLEVLVQMGVTLLDARRRSAFNSAAGLRAFRFWTELYQEGLLPREVVSQGQRRAIELFQSEDLAMAATGAEFLRSIQTNAPRVAAVTESHPPVTGIDGTANVALMMLAVPRQSKKQALAVKLALFLTGAANQLRFANEAQVLPSSTKALAMVLAQLQQERIMTAEQQQIRQARLLSAITLKRARVLVPALPGIKQLQKILYTQLQRAMLGQIGSDEALKTASDEWDYYAASREPLKRLDS